MTNINPKDIKFLQQVKLFFYLTLSINIIIIFVFSFYKNLYWAQGAFLGSLLLLTNLFFLQAYLKKEIYKKYKNIQNLKPLLSKYYILFLLTAIYCFTVIKLQLGHPFPFFITLLSLGPCLFLSILLIIIIEKYKNGKR